MYHTILFDLDGTLTDPAEGITNSVAYALEKFGIASPGKAALLKFIGPPLWDSFEMFAGLSQADANRAVAYYREYYGEKGMFENILYPGIPELLQKLKAAGKTLLVATSKLDIAAEGVLKYFNLDGYFSFVGGSNLDGSRSKKSDVIAYALKEGGISDRTTAIMVGDREHDIIGARAQGLDSLGVLYGYGDLEELEAAGADYIVSTVEEIGDVLIEK